MSELLETLNPAQKEAATTINQHVRIIAGAGSGKTRVLMARIAYLIEDVGIFPSRILEITFTNKATNEMKERLALQIGEDARSVRISTIHSLCVRILREDCQALGYPQSFVILDTDDQRQILRPFYKELDLDMKEYPMTKVLGSISSCKTNYVDPQQALELAQSKQQEVNAQLYAKYEARKAEMKAMDFDDLLLQAHHLLNSNEEVRKKWQSRLDYIHVDEFQDVDPIQYGIVRLLTSDQAILCVVGDPDQTIYTWRGASVNIILDFNKHFKNSKTIILDQNYRSTQPILNASNAVIAHNNDRIKKDLFTKLPGDDKIVEQASLDDNEEPLFVARQINDRYKKGESFKDMAILYRSNYTSRAFEKVLMKVNIPYVIYGGIRFYERREIKDALSYLRLCANKDEMDPEQFSLDLAVLRVINQPRRGIGARTLEKLQEQAQQKHVNLLEILHDPDLGGAARNKCVSFAQMVDEIRSHRDDYSLEDYLDYIMDETGYYQMLKEDHEDERIDNIKELKQDIAQNLQENPEMTLETYLQDIALFTDKTEESKHNAVSLMTIHAAKGLEFDTVFIVNFNEGIFPSTRSIQEGGHSALEEERRLCYVAMTRAKKHLYLSWNTGYSYMLDAYKTPSRFLKEIPDEYTNAVTKKVVDAQATPKMGPSMARRGKVRYRKGDLVEHTLYGQGVIISLNGDVATIAFDRKTGVKKLNSQHPSIKKVGK